MKYSRWVGGFVLGILLAVPPLAESQSPDAGLGQRVAEAVHTYPRLSIFDDVSVTVEGPNATLSGRVTSVQKKDELEALIAKIDGVRSVQNNVGVLSASPQDQRLRNEVASAIYRHPAFWQYAQLPKPPIHIIIEDRHITLTGSVGSQVDSMLAYSLAQVPGALSITNRIRVAGPPNGRSAPRGGPGKPGSAGQPTSPGSAAERKTPAGRN
jgi:osmotically-inducible protein OsmY